MTQKQARNTQEVPPEYPNKVTAKVRAKFWVRPVMLISAIWFKLIRSKASPEFIDWIVHNGFDAECIKND